MSKSIKKYIAMLLAAAMSLLGTVSAASPSLVHDGQGEQITAVEKYETPRFLDSNIEEAVNAAIAKTVAQFSLQSFLEENELDVNAIPENLPEYTLELLEELCDERLYEIAFYYCDLETGFTISYNEDRTFRAASCIKMPYMCYILHLVDEGEISLDDKITLKKSDIRDGTSTIRDENIPAGTELTIRELVEYLILDSDNTAFAMLSRKFPIWKFTAWANGNFGTDFNKAVPKEQYGGTNSMTASSTARMLKLIYDKTQNNEENYIWLIELMKNANKNTFIKYGIADTTKGIWYKDYRLDVEVAHKYGMDIYASNDAAIVYYEDRPYILVVLTDWIGYPSDGLWWTEGDMRTVSYYIFQLHKYIMSLSSKEA